MDRLREAINEHSRWQTLNVYVSRIEGYRDTDFPLCVENAKSLLETIAKEICTIKEQAFSNKDNTGKILKLAFASLGYDNTKTIQQIGGAIANIGQQMSLLRNEIGATSHGKPLAELEKRNDTINKAASDFLLFSTELVCSFLIQLFEADNPLAAKGPEISYEGNSEFNEFWDELYGEFKMGDSSFAASEILFNLEPRTYKTALNEFLLRDK